jgi:hypothetical protein
MAWQPWWSLRIRWHYPRARPPVRTLGETGDAWRQDIRYETRTTLGPKAVLERANAFFSGEFGLTLVETLADASRWEGGGGSVAVMADLTPQAPASLSN